MSTAIIALAALLAAAVAALALLRQSDAGETDRAWRALAAHATPAPAPFDPATVAGLPDPARRYFLASIAPGTPLSAVAEIRMSGEIGLGDRTAPGYRPMRGHQILAAPHGFVWRVEAGTGMARIEGSDGLAAGRSWVRFRLFGLIPVVRAGVSADHARSAFGRAVAEAAIWTPAALLPGENVAWEAVSADTARATVRHGPMSQPVDVTVDAEGRAVRVVIPRWSDANPDRTYRLQPFGGDLSGHRAFGGYTVPTRVEGGNFPGTPDYFPFYRAIVEEIRYLPGG